VCNDDICVRLILQEALVEHGAIVAIQNYKPIAPVELSVLEFVIHGDADTYVDLNIHISVREKLVAQDGSSLDPSDSTTVVNNQLHSLFSQCSFRLNGVYLFIQGSLQLPGLLRDSTHLQ
jgi:hypothetical protein